MKVVMMSEDLAVRPVLSLAPALWGFSFLSGKMGIMGKACFTVLLKGLAEVKLMNGLE